MEVILLEAVVATCRSSHGSGSVTNVVSVHMQVIYSGGSKGYSVCVSGPGFKYTHRVGNCSGSDGVSDYMYDSGSVSGSVGVSGNCSDSTIMKDSGSGEYTLYNKNSQEFLIR